MNERDHGPYRPLPGKQEDGGDQPLPAARRHAAARRDAGRAQVRRISAWTAAAVVAATAAGAGYFAHTGTTAQRAIGQATTGTAHGTGQRPSLSHPIAISGGSGVTAGGAAGAPAGGAAPSWRDN